jgi:hypothetical protein
MNDKILNKILETGFTTHELRQKIRILKIFISNQLYGVTESTDPELAKLTGWLEGLGPQFFTQFNQANYTSIFAELEKKAETLPNLVIYFAIEPNTKQLASVGSWLRESYGSQFIFDPKYDPSLIAGCALVWKGVYKDYSLKAKIAENRGQILEVIKSTISSTGNLK